MRPPPSTQRGVKRAPPPPLKSVARTNWTPPSSTAPKVRLLCPFCQKIDTTGGIWKVLARVGGKTSSLRRILPYFWLFLAILVHFGAFWLKHGHFGGHLQTGSCSYHGSKRARVRAYRSIFRQLGAWVTQICTRWGVCRAYWVKVPTIPHLYEPGGCPQDDVVLTKMHQSAQNAPK